MASMSMKFSELFPVHQSLMTWRINLPFCGIAGSDGLNPDDLANFELPPDLLKDLPEDLLKELPPEMQKDCSIM